LLFYIDERSKEPSGSLYEIHIQKLDVLVHVTTVNYIRLFSNSMGTCTKTSNFECGFHR